MTDKDNELAIKYQDKYSSNPDYRVEVKREVKKKDFDFSNAVDMNRDFYRFKSSNTPFVELKRIIAKEKALRFASNMSVLNFSEKLGFGVNYLLGRDVDYLDATTISERKKDRLVRLTDKLGEYTEQLDDNSRLLDSYQLMILEEVERHNHNYEDALERKDHYLGQMLEHKKMLEGQQDFSSSYLTALRNYLIGNRLYTGAVKDCAISLKKRDLRFGELKEVNIIGNYADAVSFHLSLLSGHTEILGEHLGYVSDSLNYLSESVREGLSIEGQIKSSTSHISRYKGLLDEILGLKKKQIASSLTSEGSKIYGAEI